MANGISSAATVVVVTLDEDSADVVVSTLGSGSVQRLDLIMVYMC